MKKLLSFALALCFMSAAFFCAAAQNGGTAEYLARSAGKQSVKELASSLGYGEEWTVFALARYGASFESYEDSFDVSAEKIINPVERERCALALAICGAKEEKIASLIKGVIGGQGIMSLVFGLHVIANGVRYEELSAEEITKQLLELQLPDGGFALFGTVSDIDVTAMTLQAIAEFYTLPGCAEAAEKALEFISGAQKENGGFTSFGSESSESISQVIIALSALGIDCGTDERFIKNGVTLINALSRYALGDGSYEHVKDGGANRIATIQALCAEVAYGMTGKSFWIFEKEETARPSAEESEESEESAENTSVPGEEKSEEVSKASDAETSEGLHEESFETALESAPGAESSLTQSEEENSETKDGESGAHIKLIILCALGSLAAAAIVALIIKRKANAINICIILAVFALAAAAVLFARIDNADEYYGRAESKTDAAGKACISVNAGGVEGKDVIIEKEYYEFAPGETVYDLLVDAARKNGVALDVSGAGAFIYIKAIDFIYERAHGELSGWVYTVNGVSASVGCASYPLSDGDIIEWSYTTDGIDRTKNETS